MKDEHNTAKKPADSESWVSELMMPHHVNNLGHVFGGVVLSMVDRAAAVAAMRHAGLAAVTVSIDRVDFREPIYAGELVNVLRAGQLRGSHVHGDRCPSGSGKPLEREEATHEQLSADLRGDRRPEPAHRRSSIALGKTTGTSRDSATGSDAAKSDGPWTESSRATEPAPATSATGPCRGARAKENEPWRCPSESGTALPISFCP